MGGTLENFIFHLIAIPAVFLLGRLSTVRVTGFHAAKKPRPKRLR
ncbi:hypothetical protein [Salinithrix halophila]|uniref:Uncharacterized protein n=1 Tax=Salinithrix halophila TaxID=1485204 RepID=A0ABV8JJV6_9BACL